MRKFAEKAIPTLFNLLFFFTPLILFPKTSELFEFNKIVFIYLLTVLIIGFWLARMILVRKIIFRRTILDFPLLIFLTSQFLSFLVSIDRHTSIFGYYGRFNGGLLSLSAYSLLYWAYVSNMDPKKTLKSIYFLLASGFLVSIYGILQHFGIDRDIWVQDVQRRVFSTLGQPNWLATFLAALIPLAWTFAMKEKRTVFWGLSASFFITLLYTKSRSGLLAFSISYLFFWGLTYLTAKRNFKPFLKLVAAVTFSLLLIIFLVGTPWTPNLGNLLTGGLAKQEENAPDDPGGTESADIRKVVWKGALGVWGNFPLFGSGPETFAYSFYQFRPKEHNLVSEWDFLYNKAHNEYLNFAATTGTVGLLAYLVLITASLFQTIKNSKIQKLKNSKLITYGFFSGYSAILVANFFGFATTGTSLLFFLFPAIVIGLESKSVEEYKYKKINSFQVSGILLSSLLGLLLFYSISKYWYSDFLFAKGRRLGDEESFGEAKEALGKAVSFVPNEPLYQNELASILSVEAQTLYELGDEKEAKSLARESIAWSQKALMLSPRNLLFLRGRSAIFIRLTELDTTYLSEAKNTMLAEAKYSPTDAKLYYNLGLAYARLDEPAEATLALEKSVALKENYRDARYALAILYLNDGRKEDAKTQLSFILEHINPDDAIVRREFQELTGK